ncbi:hypothetical protein JL722_4692 [Aureococcus anophagefferens]|nr:hypothetical protein JL722_4692 [Aureococcus anophagefferens]
MGDLEKESSLRDFEAAEDGGCLAPGRFRMSDYLSELVGAQEVTKDEAYDTAVAAAKVAKARTKQRENMDHYASKVPRLTRAVEAAKREKARREARAEAAASKAKAEGTPVPATCHAFYESSDADQVKALADAEDRLRRNEKKLEGAKGDYAATNAAAIAALTSAVADSTPETVPILKDLLTYEADIITAMLAYESRLDAAAAALPESEEPARAEPPAKPDARGRGGDRDQDRASHPPTMSDSNYAKSICKWRKINEVVDDAWLEDALSDDDVEIPGGDVFAEDARARSRPFATLDRVA